MNLTCFHCVGIVCVVVGACVGFSVGSEWAGFVGAAAGIVAGFFGGLYGGTWLAILLAFAILASAETAETLAMRRVLRPRFSRYWIRSRRPDWLDVKARVRPGEIVEGEVIATNSDDAYLDVGCGFPARLSLLETRTDEMPTEGSSDESEDR